MLSAQAKNAEQNWENYKAKFKELEVKYAEASAKSLKLQQQVDEKDGLLLESLARESGFARENTDLKKELAMSKSSNTLHHILGTGRSSGVHYGLGYGKTAAETSSGTTSGFQQRRIKTRRTSPIYCHFYRQLGHISLECLEFYKDQRR